VAAGLALSLLLIDRVFLKDSKIALAGLGNGEQSDTVISSEAPEDYYSYSSIVTILEIVADKSLATFGPAMGYDKGQDNSRWFKTDVLFLQDEDEINSTRVEVISMTPEELNALGEDGLSIIRSADLFYFKEDVNSQEKRFFKHDLSWEAIEEVFKCVAGVYRKRTGIILSTFVYQQTFGKNQTEAEKQTVNRFYQETALINNSYYTDLNSTICNVGKLYLMLTQRDIVSFYDAFMNPDTDSPYKISSVTTTSNPSGTTGAFVRPDMTDAGLSGNDMKIISVFWNAMTFIPYAYDEDTNTLIRIDMDAINARFPNMDITVNKKLLKEKYPNLNRDYMIDYTLLKTTFPHMNVTPGNGELIENVLTMNNNQFITLDFFKSVYYGLNNNNEIKLVKDYVFDAIGVNRSNIKFTDVVSYIMHYKGRTPRPRVSNPPQITFIEPVPVTEADGTESVMVDERYIEGDSFILKFTIEQSSSNMDLKILLDGKVPAGDWSKYIYELNDDVIGDIIAVDNGNKAIGNGSYAIKIPLSALKDDTGIPVNKILSVTATNKEGKATTEELLIKSMQQLPEISILEPVPIEYNDKKYIYADIDYYEMNSEDYLNNAEGMRIVIKVDKVSEFMPEIFSDGENLLDAEGHRVIVYPTDLDKISEVDITKPLAKGEYVIYIPAGIMIGNSSRTVTIRAVGPGGAADEISVTYLRRNMFPLD
jgi:hypothetical protein